MSPWLSGSAFPPTAAGRGSSALLVLLGRSRPLESTYLPRLSPLVDSDIRFVTAWMSCRCSVELRLEKLSGASPDGFWDNFVVINRRRTPLDFFCVRRTGLLCSFRLG